jgi:hypothetical protein
MTWVWSLSIANFRPQFTIQLGSLSIYTNIPSNTIEIQSKVIAGYSACTSITIYTKEASQLVLITPLSGAVRLELVTVGAPRILLTRPLDVFNKVLHLYHEDQLISRAANSIQNSTPTIIYSLLSCTS